VAWGAGAPPAGADPTDREASRAEAIRRVEDGFSPILLAPGEAPTPMNLSRLMEISHVHGLSIAVFRHYRLAWAKGYGVREAGRDDPFTPETLFQAASISKPVSAIAILHLVQDGRLSLDTDVNQQLRSWQVPSNAFTRDQKVTLRRILTHTSGVIVHGFPGYPVGTPEPTLLQVLRGEAPANTPALTVDFAPGTKQRYSGGGFVIGQQLLADVTGESFDQLMKTLVLQKLGLRRSTFEQPLPSWGLANVATGHDETGSPIPGKWNVGPELAVGGLWTTPADLGRIMAELALEAQGRSNLLLSPTTVREMLRLQTPSKIETEEGPPMRMGLGWMLIDSGAEHWFEHSGVNRGYVAEALMNEAGDGVVVMANSESFTAQLVMRYVVNNVAETYGWTYRVTPYTPWPYADTVVLASATLRGAQAAIARYQELKAVSGQRDAAGRLKAVWTSDPPDFLPNEWDLLGIAQVLGDKSHLRDAIALLQVEVHEYPRFWQGWDILGLLSEGAGDRDAAVSAFRKVLELNPRSRDASAGLERLNARPAN